MRPPLAGYVRPPLELLLLLPSERPLPPSSVRALRRPLRRPCVWLPRLPPLPWLPPPLWPWRRPLLFPQQYVLLPGVVQRARARLRQIVSFAELRKRSASCPSYRLGHFPSFANWLRPW